MYNPSSPTCVSDHASFSACTARRSLPAISVPSPLSTCTTRQFLPASPTTPAFRMYNSLIPTYGFGFLSLSARTTRRFLPASPFPPRFPHVQLANPYLRLRSHHVFRMYNPLIPTCVSDLLLLPAHLKTFSSYFPAKVSNSSPNLALRKNLYSGCDPLF